MLVRLQVWPVLTTAPCSCLWSYNYADDLVAYSVTPNLKRGLYAFPFGTPEEN